MICAARRMLVSCRGKQQVLGSISGQNIPWAQYLAYPALSASKASQDSGWGSTNTNSATSGANGGSAVGGSTGSMLFDRMNFALLAFADGTGGPSRAGGQSGGTSSTGSTAASTTQGSDPSKIFAGLEALFASFTGTTASSGTSDTTATSGNSSSV